MFDEVDLKLIKECGGSVYDGSTEIEGTRLRRPGGRGNCLYHAANESNDEEAAQNSRVFVAGHMERNPNEVFGVRTLKEMITTRSVEEYCALMTGGKGQNDCQLRWGGAKFSLQLRSF
jgi:hypothetical protein